MRQRVNHRRVHRQNRVKQMRQADTLRLRDEAEERAIAVKTPWPPVLDNFEARLIVPI